MNIASIIVSKLIRYDTILIFLSNIVKVLPRQYHGDRFYLKNNINNNYNYSYYPESKDLVHLNTSSVDMPYLDTKNYGAMYIKYVLADLVHPDTNSVG